MHQRDTSAAFKNVKKKMAELVRPTSFSKKRTQSVLN
jgi:hypothetical protein